MYGVRRKIDASHRILSQVATWPAELFFHFHFSDSFVPIPVPTDNENGLHYQCALLFTIWIWTDNCAVILSVRVVVGLRKVHLGLHFFIPQSCVSHVYRTERNGSKVVVILECHCKNANTYSHHIHFHQHLRFHSHGIPWNPRDPATPTLVREFFRKSPPCPPGRTFVATKFNTQLYFTTMW